MVWAAREERKQGRGRQIGASPSREDRRVSSLPMAGYYDLLSVITKGNEWQPKRFSTRFGSEMTMSTRVVLQVEFYKALF
jgi:hypothetical protein